MTDRQPSALEERIDMLTRELVSKRRSTNWGANLTLIIGLLFIMLLCVYFGFGYYLLNDATKPDRIVASAKGMIDEYAREARTMASDEIRKSAPIWAQEVSTEIIKNLPEVREQAEIALADVLDKQLRAGQSITTEQFRKLLKENREEFQEAINNLTEDNTEEFVGTVMPIVEKQYVPALKKDAIQILGVLDELNRRLDRLATADDLNPVEKQQRHILGLTRLYREKRAPETFDRGEIRSASN